MAHIVLDYEQISSLSSVKTLTVPAGTRTVWLLAETKDVRYTLDGSTPDASTGMILKAGAEQPLVLNNVNAINAAKFIEVSASAKLNVTYFGDDA